MEAVLTKAAGTDLRLPAHAEAAPRYSVPVADASKVSILVVITPAATDVFIVMPAVIRSPPDGNWKITIPILNFMREYSIRRLLYREKGM